MSWLISKKKKEQSVQLDLVKSRVDDLETRVDSITDVLIQRLDDPWAQSILKSIYESRKN